MFAKRLFYIVTIIWIGITFTSCDKPGVPYPGGIIGGGDIEALVLNEGKLNTNTGTISVIYKDGRCGRCFSRCKSPSYGRRGAIYHVGKWEVFRGDE